MKHLSTVNLFRNALLTTLLALATLPVAAQGTTDNEPSKVTVVDDEACGCELVFIDGIQTTERNGLFGFKREDGSIISEPVFKFVDKFHGDYCIVYSDYNQCGLLHRDGRMILPLGYEEINYPSDGIIRIKQKELYGFADTSGQIIIAPQYRAASGFNEGLAVVAIDIDSNLVSYGYIDRKNTIRIAPQFEYANPFEEGYAIVKRYDRFGMIDHQGHERTPIKYIEMTPMHDGTFFAVDAQTEKAALFNKSFKQLTPFIYDQVTHYSEGFYVVRRNDKVIFLNLKGKESKGMYDAVSGFINGYSWVMKDHKYGIVNRKGKIILPIEYDNSGYRSMEYLYSEGLFMIEKAGKFGFADTRGKIVIPMEYQSALQCTEGLIPVQKNGMWGYIDKNGERVTDFIFDLASHFEWGRAEVVYNGEVYKINPGIECVKNCKTFPKIWHR